MRALFFTIAGVILILIGIPLLVLPGPGIVTILAGAGLIAAGWRGKRPNDESPPGA